MSRARELGQPALAITDHGNLPDVDFDFADNRRDEVIRYAAERYGRDRVAQIVTFGRLGAKAAVRDTSSRLTRNGRQRKRASATR